MSDLQPELAALREEIRATVRWQRFLKNVRLSIMITLLGVITYHLLA